MTIKVNSRGKIGLATALTIFILVVVAIIWRTTSLYSLQKSADSAFQKGDYLTALVKYSTLQDKHETEETFGKIEKTKKFIVAEENFLRAKEASEEGDWLEVKPLIDDARVADPNFKYYDDVRKLYSEASDKIEFLEKKIEGEIQILKKEAETQKLEKEAAKSETERIRTNLEATISEKEKYESLADESERRAKEALREAEKERFEKFLNELSLLVEMAENGDAYLEDAINDIDNNKDTSAFVFINQARILFDNVKKNANELKQNRTPVENLAMADGLLQSAGYFISSSRNLANAVIYIDEKNDNFYLYFDQGKSLKNSAAKELDKIRGFINSSY